jgi:hypothetical protein
MGSEVIRQPLFLFNVKRESMPISADKMNYVIVKGKWVNKIQVKIKIRFTHFFQHFAPAFYAWSHSPNIRTICNIL